MSKITKFFISLIIPFVAGGIGSIFTFKAIPTWYASLNKPSFNPPNWLFGPAWAILYILIGISLFLVLIENIENKNKKISLIVFFSQIILNMLWSIIFFGLKSPISALVCIIFLWISILLNIISFYKINKKAGLILIPYICWVTFAGLLNLFVVILN